jgi:hypothetical protein
MHPFNQTVYTALMHLNLKPVTGTHISCPTHNTAGGLHARDAKTPCENSSRIQPAQTGQTGLQARAHALQGKRSVSIKGIL